MSERTEYLDCGCAMVWGILNPCEKHKGQAESRMTIELLDTLVDDVDTTVLIGRVRGQFMATVGVQYQARMAAAIRGLYVHEDFRRLGYGKELVCECARIARGAGCEALSLLLAKENVELLPTFYRTLGFGVTSQYPDGDLALSMRLAKYSAAWQGGGNS